MRLLQTNTLQFKEFFDSQIPPYAILSHRWSDREVSFKEMRNCTAPQGSGMTKIQNFCRLAAARGFDWAWIDTCCIDKRSSAELSEAINAMYKWYERSGECYVHLSDVECSSHDLPLKKGYEDKFRTSSWFTRGWTLQELLAPQKSKVFFFDGNWNEIGGLPQLASAVSEITGIGEEYMGFKHSFGYEKPMAAFTPCAYTSVAKRMSWVSRRQTSREEDMAYCLLGLFDVNMPLLYGEGAQKAFLRLQIEIMKINDDESLFAWTSSQEISGMLAASPSFFAHSGDISQGWKGTRRPYSMTNKGLELSVPKKHIAEKGPTGSIVVSLDCFRDKERVPLALLLERYGGFGAYRRKCHNVDAIGLSSELKNWTLEGLYENLKDSCLVYVFDPEDEKYQRRLIRYKQIAEHESQQDRKRPDQAAQQPPSDPLMIEEGSPHKKRKI